MVQLPLSVSIYPPHMGQGWPLHPIKGRGAVRPCGRTLTEFWHGVHFHPLIILRTFSNSSNLPCFVIWSYRTRGKSTRLATEFTAQNSLDTWYFADGRSSCLNSNPSPVKRARSVSDDPTSTSHRLPVSLHRLPVCCLASSFYLDRTSLLLLATWKMKAISRYVSGV